MVDRFSGFSLDFLAPRRCFWCRRRLAGGLACDRCRERLPWNRGACRTCALPLAGPPDPARSCPACADTAPPQDSGWAAFRYESPISAQILELKFHGRLQAAPLLAGLLAGTLIARPEPLPEVLIPVPLHASRLRRRGYNQALEIGRELCRHLAISLVPDAARRERATREQTRLTATERRRNVRGVFRVDGAVRDRHIALLDDVITTGATGAELARAARAAGAARIEVWAVARA